MFHANAEGEVEEQAIVEVTAGSMQTIRAAPEMPVIRKTGVNQDARHVLGVRDELTDKCY